MKRCAKCAQDKPLEEFAQRSDTAKAKSWCTSCVRSYQREWMAAYRTTSRGRRAVRERTRKLKFGISQEEFLEMLADQDGACAVCGIDLDPEARTTVLDHDHACCSGPRTCGRCLRAILCARCNMLVGIWETNPDLFEAVRLYVESWAYDGQGVVLSFTDQPKDRADTPTRSEGGDDR